MKIVKKDLWISRDSLILTSGNSFITKKGKLVMGRGAAKQARNKFPDLDWYLGNYIYSTCGHLGFYGVALDINQANGVFQTKFHFKNNSTLEIIKQSVYVLNMFLESYPNLTVSMNYPGIGLGNLNEEQVYPVIVNLSNRVTVYRGE